MALVHFSPNQPILINEPKIFNEIIAALKKNDTETIKKAIATTPDIFFKRSESGNTLLHLAATFANLENNEIILNFLKQQNALAMMADIHDRDGNNILHLASRNNTPEVVQYIVTALGEQAFYLAKIFNNQNYLPFNCTAKNFDRACIEPIQATLFPLMLDYSDKPPLAPLDINVILQEHPNCSPALKENLHRACNAINLARKNIIDSETMPDYKFHRTAKSLDFKFSPEKYQEIKKVRLSLTSRIRKLREILAPIWLKIEDEKATILEQKRAIANAVKIIEEHKIANCAELSILTLHYLSNEPLTTPLTIDLASFDDVDHSYIIFGHDPKHTDFNNPDTWPDEMVVADALTGRVVQAIKIFFECMIYERFEWQGFYYNVLAYVNLNIHNIYSDLSIQFPKSTLAADEKSITLSSNPATLFPPPNNADKPNTNPANTKAALQL